MIKSAIASTNPKKRKYVRFALDNDEEHRLGRTNALKAQETRAPASGSWSFMSALSDHLSLLAKPFVWLRHQMNKEQDDGHLIAEDVPRMPGSWPTAQTALTHRYAFIQPSLSPTHLHELLQHCLIGILAS